MCGIAGFLLNGSTTPGDPESVLRGMGQAIRHRGPDADGHLWEPELGLGLAHRRLSIQDLSPLGAQPMQSASGRYSIAFNGEIYNFAVLRKELEGMGHSFRGHSDTEVMLAAFEAWGVEKAVDRFAGMFAFALLDRETHCVWLARDRMGEKPLYYGWHGATLLFASELKALLAFPGFSPAVNRDALTLLLRHNYIPAPHSIYENVWKLPPAHSLRVDLHSPDRLKPQRYWSVDQAMAHPASMDAQEASQALEQSLSCIIGEQMVADVPLGAFLSGGIDSSTVVALMQQQSPQPVRTFTIGFDEEGFNEAEHAAAVAAHLGTEHTALYVTADDALNVVPGLPRIYDEPFADSSQIPTYLISRLTRQHVTVSLSGDGGDELMAGYSRYPGAVRGWEARHVSPSARQRLERLLLSLPDTFAEPLVRALKGNYRRLSGVAVREKLQRERLLLGSDALEDYYREAVGYWNAPARIATGGKEPGYALNQPLPPPVRDLHPVQQLQWLDLHTYLPDDILTKVDRAAMAVSLETRVPMLDHRFVEFALSLPPALNVKGGIGKQPLREVLYRHVPRELVDRPKQGFAVPVARWLRGELRDWADELLAPERLKREGYWNVEAVSALWNDHRKGMADFSFHLWGVLMFQAWLEEASRPLSP